MELSWKWIDCIFPQWLLILATIRAFTIVGVLKDSFPPHEPEPRPNLADFFRLDEDDVKEGDQEKDWLEKIDRIRSNFCDTRAE